MPGSDKLNLDPVAAAGDPMERLNARVAELERQLTNLRVPAMSPPKARVFPITSGVYGPVTYSASGGYVVIMASALLSVANTASWTTGAALLVDGVVRDSASLTTGDPDPNDGTTHLLAYAPGKWTGNHTIELQDTSNHGGMYKGNIVVIELPFSG